jgi:hypothetical protein
MMPRGISWVFSRAIILIMSKDQEWGIFRAVGEHYVIESMM